jgi:hypothetical protein
MQRNKYLEDAFKKYNEEKISAEAYDAILENIDAFCDEDEDKNKEFQKELIIEQQEQM